MIGGARITITAELAQAVGDLAKDYPDAAITIEWDYRDGRPENEWRVTADSGTGPVGFVLDDQDVRSYIGRYGSEAGE